MSDNYGPEGCWQHYAGISRTCPGCMLMEPLKQALCGAAFVQGQMLADMEFLYRATHERRPGMTWAYFGSGLPEAFTKGEP